MLLRRLEPLKVLTKPLMLLSSLRLHPSLERRFEISV